MKVLVIIPAYNEEENIVRVVENLRTNYPQYDYVVINDCSTDSTESILKSHGYSYINLPVNLGIGGGVQTGYQYAAQNGYDVAVQMDGDGQHDPAYIEALIRPIGDGTADMSVGSRFIEKRGFQTSFMRRVGIRFLSGVIRFCCGARITDATSGFRATNAEATAFFAKTYAKDYPEPEAIVVASRCGFGVCEVPVQMKERVGGVSSIKAMKSVYYMIKVTLALLIAKIGLPKKKRSV